MNCNETKMELRADLQNLRSELEATTKLRRQSGGALGIIGSILIGGIGGALLMWLIASLGVSNENIIFLPVLGVVAALAKSFQVNRKLDRRIDELSRIVPDMENQLDRL